MKVRAVRPFIGDEGMVEVGEVVAVCGVRARELEIRGLAVPLVDAKLVNALKEAASEGAPHPTKTPPIGGPTGGDQLALLSPPDPAPRKRNSTRRKAKRGS